MKGTIVTVPTEGEITTQEVDHAEVLPILQKIVGGFIEVVPGFDTYQPTKVGGPMVTTCVAFCNEDGLATGLPLNVGASRLWFEAVSRRRAGAAVPTLVGPVAIVYGDAEFMKAL